MKKYPDFKPGDEVYTEKHNWKAISANIPYIVLDCYAQTDLAEDTYVRVIDIKTDLGFVSKYATNRFKKTALQLRHDKIAGVLNE